MYIISIDEFAHLPLIKNNLRIRAGSNSIDIKVLRHHTVSVSNFQSMDDWIVHL